MESHITQKQPVDEFHPTVQDLIEVGYSVKQSVEAVERHKGLEEALDYLAQDQLNEKQEETFDNLTNCDHPQQPTLITLQEDQCKGEENWTSLYMVQLMLKVEKVSLVPRPIIIAHKLALISLESTER